MDIMGQTRIWWQSRRRGSSGARTPDSPPGGGAIARASADDTTMRDDDAETGARARDALARHGEAFMAMFDADDDGQRGLPEDRYFATTGSRQ